MPFTCVQLSTKFLRFFEVGDYFDKLKRFSIARNKWMLRILGTLFAIYTVLVKRIKCKKHKKTYGLSPGTFSVPSWLIGGPNMAGSVPLIKLVDERRTDRLVRASIRILTGEN